MLKTFIGGSWTAGSGDPAEVILPWDAGVIEVVDQASSTAPTVFADVHRDMRVIREETFGPIMTVGRFRIEEEVTTPAKHLAGSPAMVHRVNGTEEAHVAR